MKRNLAALILAIFASSAGAQTVYKSIMPDGRIIYGEKPAEGAKKVETIETPPAKTGTTVITPEEQARAAEGKQPPFVPPVPPGRTPEGQDDTLRSRMPRRRWRPAGSRCPGNAWEPWAAKAGSRKPTSNVRRVSKTRLPRPANAWTRTSFGVSKSDSDTLF